LVILAKKKRKKSYDDVHIEKENGKQSEEKEEWKGGREDK
jgi:hypothetical protein